MKAIGSHPDRALTAVKIRNLKTPGRYADGNGLYLVVDASGAKRWALRTMVHGRRRDMGLGSLRLVSLAEAREEATRHRKLARQGGDPFAERRRARRQVPTFAEAARTVHAEHRPAWRNAKHGSQWLNTLMQYAFPVLGDMRVDRITTPDVLRVLSPIWLTKPETARRVRQRIKTVMDWAKAAGFCTGDNPVQAVTKGLPKASGRVNHHVALPYAQVPAFLAALRASGGNMGALAFEFLVLTAARTSEVLHARWDEIDIEQRLWTVPARRMKSGRVHRVPLSDASLAVIARARAQGCGSLWVFPGTSGTKAMSGMVFLMTLRRMQLAVTAHGFRSSFRDWASETTSFPREVCEQALAHAVGDKVEAAYRRGDLFEKRRQLMDAWARFCAGPNRQTSAGIDSARGLGHASTPDLEASLSTSS